MKNEQILLHLQIRPLVGLVILSVLSLVYSQNVGPRGFVNPYIPWKDEGFDLKKAPHNLFAEFTDLDEACVGCEQKEFWDKQNKIFGFKNLRYSMGPAFIWQSGFVGGLNDYRSMMWNSPYWGGFNNFDNRFWMFDNSPFFYSPFQRFGGPFMGFGGAYRGFGGPFMGFQDRAFLFDRIQAVAPQVNVQYDITENIRFGFSVIQNFDYFYDNSVVGTNLYHQSNRFNQRFQNIRRPPQ
jgi:hypothetical protein